MRYIIILFICLFAYNSQAQLQPQQVPSTYAESLQKNKYPYKLSKEKWIGWSQVAVGSFLIGFRDRYVLDGRIFFEEHWGSAPRSFWGSESWRNVYVNGDPTQGFKSRWAEWTGARDFYHVSGDAGKFLLISGGLTMTLGDKKPWWHHAINLGASLIISSGFDRLGYNLAKL